MKNISIVFTLLLLLMSTGSAQENSSLELFVGSGYVVPSSPMTFSNYWKMQYGGSVGVGMELTSSIALVGFVEYYRFALNQDGVNKAFDTQYMRNIWVFNDVSLKPSAEPSSVLTISANVRVTPSGISGVIAPYLIAGGGIMSLTLSEIALPTTSILTTNAGNIAMTAEQRIVGGTETAGFLQGGIGLTVDISSVVTPFLEARYILGFTHGVNTSYVPLGAGVKIRI